VVRAPQGLVADVIASSFVDGPGNRYVLFLQGCPFDCVACHNPQTIPDTSAVARLMSVDDVIVDIEPVAPFLSGVTVSGGEATHQPEFLLALFTALRDHRHLGALTRLIDSNGAADAATWDRLLPVSDGVMLDLKALDPDVHLRLTHRPNDQVLASIRHVAAAGKLTEVRLLLVPGENDSDEQLVRTARFLLAVDPEITVKVIGFRRHGTRATAHQWDEPDAERRAAYGEVLRTAGIRRLSVV
jgi:pyruvate formate lyase activating enzyme